MSVDGVMVANAALMEVGLPANAYRAGRDVAYGGRFTPAVHRALMLSRLAECGPDSLARCRICSPLGALSSPCTPVRDALRGFTCGGQS